MLQHTVLRFINHLLTAENWAPVRLKPFVGQQVTLNLGLTQFSFRIAGDGTLLAGDASLPAAVSIDFPDISPLAFLSVDRATLLSQARISGTADLAEALAFIARSLSWDVESDLARFVGDIPAHRIASAGRHVLSNGRDILERFRSNISEYCADEQRGLVNRREIDAFRFQLAELTADLNRLDQQAHRLSQN